MAKQLSSFLAELKAAHPSETSWIDKSLEVSVDEVARSLVTSLPASSGFIDRLTEQLGSDISSALDRCLAWRRESMQFQSDACRCALDLIHQKARLSIERTFLTTQLNSQVLDSTSLAFAAAAEKFGADANEAVAAGFAAYNAGMRASTDQSAAIERTRVESQLSLNDEDTEYLEQLSTRMQLSGHALNFSERRRRALGYLKLELTEAYQKSIPFASGLARFGITQVIPSPSNIATGLDIDGTKKDYIDCFVLWCRESLRQLEIARTNENVIDLHVSLTGLTAAASSFVGSGLAGPPTRVDFNNFLQGVTGALSLQLVDILPRAGFLSTHHFHNPDDPDDPNDPVAPEPLLRLQGVAATAVFSTDALVSKNHQIPVGLWFEENPPLYNISPPKTDTMYNYQRTPDISLLAGVLRNEGDLPWQSTNAIWNKNPSKGCFVKIGRIALAPSRISADHQSTGSDEGLEDIIIHLRVAGNIPFSNCQFG